MQVEGWSGKGGERGKGKERSRRIKRDGKGGDEKVEIFFFKQRTACKI